MKCYTVNSYLAIREPLEAARILARRTDQSALRAAVLICLAANQLEAAKMYGRKYIQQCLMVFDWTAVKEVLQAHPCFKVNQYSTSSTQDRLTYFNLFTYQLLLKVLMKVMMLYIFTDFIPCVMPASFQQSLDHYQCAAVVLNGCCGFV